MFLFPSLRAPAPPPPVCEQLLPLQLSSAWPPPPPPGRSDVYVRVCMWVHVCVNGCAYHVCVQYLCLYVYARDHLYVCISDTTLNVCRCVRTGHMCAHMYVCICTRANVRMRVSVNARMYVVSNMHACMHAMHLMFACMHKLSACVAM